VDRGGDGRPRRDRRGRGSGGYGIAAHLRNKDGVLVALAVAAAHAAEPIDDRIDRLRAEHGDIVQRGRSVDCPEDRKSAVLDRLGADRPASIAGADVERVERTDGFKFVLAGGSWLLVRPSGTEPKLRLYAEAGDDDRVEELLSAGVALVEPFV